MRKVEHELKQLEREEEKKLSDGAGVRDEEIGKGEEGRRFKKNVDNEIYRNKKRKQQKIL